MTTLRYRPELDGLRSVAVYLVLAFHAGLAEVNGGFVGVDLFFVLSGFLVTGVILREVDQRGTFSLGGFYSRRVRRLLPAAVVVVVATAALQILLVSLPARLELVGDARASLLYFANWHFIAESRDYFAQGDQVSPFLHFWSLSIEEQFYIGFPLVVLLTLKASRRPVRLLAALLAGIIAVSVSLQIWHATRDADYAYYATDTRIYQLAVGALLTLVVRAFHSDRSIPSRWATPMASIAMVALLVVASDLIDAPASTRGILATMASALIVLGLWWAPDGWTSRLLALPLPRYLGQVSYGTYLWHWPVLLLLRQVFDVRPLVLAALACVAATALAALSFQLVEMPIRRARVAEPRRWLVVVSALAVSATVAAIAVPNVLDLNRRPAISSGSASPLEDRATALDRPVPEDLDLVRASKDRASRAPMCTVDDPDGCVLVRGEGAHVLLLGDSQARMFVPAFEALAREHDLTLSSNTLNACAWQAGQINLRATAAGRQECFEGRETFFAEVLPELDVDVVLAIGLSRSDRYWETRVEAQDGPGNETLAEIQLRTTEETAETITASGPRLVIAKSLFGTGGFGLDGFDPIECLATADVLADCAVSPPLGRPIVDSVYDVLATRHDDVGTVDFNPAICPSPPLCSPVDGDTVVWIDPDHVTTTYLVERRRALWRRLLGTGALG